MSSAKQAGHESSNEVIEEQVLDHTGEGLGINDLELGAYFPRTTTPSSRPKPKHGNKVNPSQTVNNYPCLSSDVRPDTTKIW